MNSRTECFDNLFSKKILPEHISQIKSLSQKMLNTNSHLTSKYPI